MNNPVDHVDVGPFHYAVKFDAAEVKRLEEKNKQEYLGCCSFEEELIAINPNQTSDNLAETLFHEIMHAVFGLSGATGRMMREEDAIGRLCPMLLDTLRRNPQLVDYLMDRRRDDN